MGTFIDLTGQQFGEWEAVEYEGKSMWKCRNIHTREEKSIHSYSLRTQYSDHTKINKKAPAEDLANKQFGEWTALEYIGSARWKCKCSCGNDGIVSSTDLIKGTSKRCNNPIHKLKHNLTGQTFGLWKVLDYAGEMRWRCECQCENHTVKNILTRDLINGVSKSCGCNRNYHIIHKDITGQTFNNLLVLGYTGADNLWRCKCLACGNENFITHRDSILTGKTKSCGCLKEQLRKETMLAKYGDTNTTRILNPREQWQIDALDSKENISKIINDNKNITVTELAKLLDVTEPSLIKALRKYELDNIVKEYNGVSSIELSVRNFIESLGYSIVTNDRKLLKGQEIDIYIPELKLAIEFNGNYWHSSLCKDKKYHQNKTIACARLGIHLIHIFEYEWRDEVTQAKLKEYLKGIIQKDSKKLIYARNTTIKLINSEKTREFLNKYHLQGYTTSSIELGCFDNNTDELLGVMTFGKSRFDTEADYEIIRLCWKSDITVVGGTQKLFNTFVKSYDVEYMVTYADVSKFTGNIYLDLGFKTEGISEPGYVWVNNRDNTVLKRYQTMKHKLIEQGFGSYGSTEDEIMENLGYLKIYNSGNVKLHWSKRDYVN